MAAAERLRGIDAALPGGYRARDFRDEDREAIVAQRNARLPEVERRSAEERREWERSGRRPTDTGRSGAASRPRST
ncbi:MAG: hypothetical protein KGJ98_05165 [Chloroflexota bacterium]|nr:hypothetical protein [Chloroflexota bacterium]